MAMQKAATKVLQRYWRLSRGLTLGAQGMIFDDDGRILLIRHTYRPGWHFPGGGVERGETIVTALRREVAEETGVEILGVPELRGVFANFKAFPSDHIALFVVRDWRQPSVPPPNREIAEQRFVPPGALPEGTTDAVRRRLAEIASDAAASVDW